MSTAGAGLADVLMQCSAAGWFALAQSACCLVVISAVALFFSCLVSIAAWLSQASISGFIHQDC
jgi:hypothetical protein